MTNNCLVTKFKSVVSNNNLKYLDKVVFTVTLQDDFPSSTTAIMRVTASDGTPLSDFSVSTSNTDGAVVDYASGNIRVLKGSTDTVVIILQSKYAIRALTFLDSKCSMNFLDFTELYSLEKLTINNKNLINLSDFDTFPNLDYIKFNQITETTDISALSGCDSLETIDVFYCPGVVGDLSSIKNLNNLSVLTLNHMNVTDTQNTVAYFTERGVTVTYTPY